MIEKYIDLWKESEIELDLKYLKIIDDLFQNTILTQNDLFSNLEGFISSFTKEKMDLLSSIYGNEEKIKRFFDMHFESECNFVRKIIKYIQNNDINSLVLLWDLDQTIIAKSSNWNNSFSDYVRPSFIFLSKYLKYYLPQIQNWILSSRAFSNVYRVKESLNSIIYTTPFFDNNLTFSSIDSCSSEFEDETLRDYFDKKLPDQSFIQKANMHYRVSSNQKPKKVILIDDILLPFYEKLGKWISIETPISFRFPRFWMDIRSLQRNHEIYFISQLVNVLND